MGFKTSFGMDGDPLKIVRLNKEGRAVAIPMSIPSEFGDATVQIFVGLGSDNKLTIIERGKVLSIEEEAALAEWESLPAIGMLGQIPGLDNPGDGTGS